MNILREKTKQAKRAKQAKVLSDIFACFALFACFVFSPLSSVFPQSGNAKPLAGYNVVVVDKVVVDQTPATAKFPAGSDNALQQQIIEKFKDNKLFDEVIDGTIKDEDQQAASTPAPPAANKRLILLTSIIEFNPGNKALRRTIGFGAGATKVKIKFVFRDAADNREVFTTTQQGKFWGFVEVFGSGRNHSVTEASGDVIDGLIREINKNR